MNGISIPKSAADAIPVKAAPSAEEDKTILMIVSEKEIWLSVSDALTTIGILAAQVQGKLAHERR